MGFGRAAATAFLAGGFLAAGLPTPAAGQVACPGHTTIRSADTLASIANRCGVTIPGLLAANPDVRGERDLRVGRDIVVPHPTSPQPTPQQACGAFYSLRSGDTLDRIARMCGLTVPLLIAANGPMEEPVGLRAGHQIRIPNLPRVAIRDTLTWVAETPLPAVADTVAEEELIREDGVLVAGSPCMGLRTADGRTVALAEPPGRAFQPGDRVTVMGTAAPRQACGSGPALTVRIAYRPD
jgi:LysM repeat protein